MTTTTERKYRLHTTGKGKKQFLHFSGVIWTENPSYAWTGTLSQMNLLCPPKSPDGSKLRAEIDRGKHS